MNLDALFTREAAAALPEGSKERALATLALRRFWHAVFDPCPLLSRRWGERNREFLDPFLADAAREGLSMRWTLHARLLPWLRRTRRADLTPELARELLAAAAARWALEDLSEAKGVLLYTADLREEALAAWKPASPERDLRVALVKLPAPGLDADRVFFATCAEERYPDAPRWEPVPL